MIVADANLIAALFLGQEAPAKRVLQRSPVWFVPPLWRSELRSTLTKFTKARTLDVTEAHSCLAIAEAHLRHFEVPVDSAVLLDLAMQSGCTSYDCEYVSIALALDLPLVTADRQVLTAFPTIAVSIADYAQNS